MAYILIAVFALLPYARIHGKPAVLLNVPDREFTLFGFTFLPTDTLLLALFLVSGIVGICLATALAGRVWCGWMCPQTVYLEFVYRPLERLFDGPPRARHRRGRKSTPLRTTLKYATYLVISALLAHTFLAYFVGVENLAKWVRRSPLEHPTSFLVMLAVTGLMMFDFSFFREQTCIVACPYGRFQSVMLDRESLIVSYDPNRGEPRGKRRKQEEDSTSGDCIDCGLCTDTCPTGIDIRDGLQMECIACAQCVDACDHVMARVGRPKGLIRYSSQAKIADDRNRFLRPRVVLYPALMLVLLTAFGLVLANKQSADITLLRGLGRPFTELVPGEITNQIRVKIKNRSDEDAAYSIQIAEDVPGAEIKGQNPVEVAAGALRTEAVLVTLPSSAFTEGKYDITLRVSDGKQFTEELEYRLLGPYGQTSQPESESPRQEAADG